MKSPSEPSELLEADRMLRHALGARAGESIKEAAGRVAVEGRRELPAFHIAKEILFGDGDGREVFLRAARLLMRVI